MRILTKPLALCVSALLLSTFAQAETATLQHDNNGNVTQRTTPQGTTTYQYDALNRLTGESGPAKTQTITYDENGNRKSDGAGTYTIDPASNRLSTRLGLAVQYDSTGNMTADGTGRTFTYNPLGQLYQVFQSGTLIASYFYDANGMRSRKVTMASAPQGAQTILYEYDEEAHLIGEVSGTGAPLHAYAWRDDTPVSQIDYQPSRRILYFGVDHLNTSRTAMDSTGKVVWRWESDAFGSTPPNEDPGNTGSKTTVNLRFGGWYADVESGLFYAKFRYYSPLLPGFTQPDRLDVVRQAMNPMYAGYSQPMDLKKPLNQPYTYVGENPLTHTDPLGLIWPFDMFECMSARDEIEKAQNECKREYAQCKTEKEEIEFLEKYGGGFESTAIFNCAQQKAPGAWKKLVNSCGRAAISPRGPWPLKK